MNDNHNNDVIENGNNDIHDKDEYVEPTNENDTVPQNVNTEETEEERTTTLVESQEWTQNRYHQYKSKTNEPNVN